MPKFNGGTHYHYYSPPTQKELNLESKEVCTFRIAPSFLKYIEKKAAQSGISRSNYIEASLYKYHKIEKATKEAHALLDDIVLKNF